MLHVSISIILASDGTYQRQTIDSERAGELLATMANEVQIHIGHRNTADMLERISSIKIPSAALRVANQTRIEGLAIGDAILCLRLRDGVDKRGRIDENDVEFSTIERVL